MPIVTGNLSTFGQSPFPPGTQVVFKPSGPASSVIIPSLIFGTKDIAADTDAAGDFTATLVSNELLSPATWYDVSLRWLNPNIGYYDVDMIPWRIIVPVDGGTLGDLLQQPSNPAQVYINLTPPDNPTPGTWWFKTNPDNLNDPANTGLIYEWTI